MNYTAKDHTFVVCAYKESPYLEKCIHSLQKQTTLSNIIISTSTPCEHISAIADKYNLPLIISEWPTGIANDWNYAYTHVSTPLVTIAHQDDIYLPDYLTTILDAVNKADSPLIAFTGYGELRGKKAVYSNQLLNIKKLLLFPLQFKPLQKSKFIRRRCLSLGSCICCPSVTFIKENLPEKPFKSELKSNLDWQAWEEISRLDGQFVYCKKPLMLHRIHEESETSRIIGDNKRGSEDYYMFKRFWPTPIAKLINKVYSSGEKSNEL